MNSIRHKKVGLNDRIKLCVSILFFILFTNVSIFGQQAPQNSLYMLDPYQINPAYAGFARSLSINFNFRNQWSGIPGHPKQIYLNGHLPIYLLDGGAGFYLTNDNTAGISSTGFGLSYNRVIALPNALISGSIQLGLLQRKLDGGTIVTPDGIYDPSLISHEDPILSESALTGSAFHWTAAVFVRADYFDAGLTISNIPNKSILVGDGQISSNKLFGFYAKTSLVIGQLRIEPSILLKSNLQFMQTDLSVVVKSGSIFGGLSVRGLNSDSFDSVVILGGIKLNNHYLLAYSYDVGISDLKTVSQGAHELHINYNLNKLIGIGLPPEKIFNPRNL